MAEAVTIVLLLGIVGPQRRRWVLSRLLAARLPIWALRLTNTWI